ncbi:MAG: Resolvase, N-terminal domain [Bryobacterales bacterium]|nr:Resolvase, N-terminal domain [Bryobacterales bacterium]
MTKAFAYLRVSGKGQIDEGGVPRQFKAIREYAKANEIEIVRLFEGKGVSGAVEGINPRVWAEIVGMISADGVKTLLVERLGRLGWDLPTQEYILHGLKKRGITLVSVTEPDLGSTDPTREMLRQSLGEVDQKNDFISKFRAARQRKKAKEGRCEGAKPYGHRPGEEAVIGRMKELRAAGLGFDKIAAQLNAEGLKPRRGERWHGLTVNRTLTGKGRLAFTAAEPTVAV